MAPVQQLGVLAFASAVLAVPHAQWQPFKRHAHAAAPPAYESSAVPSYGPGSSSADPISSSAPPAYPSGSSASWDPVSSSAAPSYPSASSFWGTGYPSGSSAEPVSSSSAPPYPSPSGSSSWGAVGTGTGVYVKPTGYSSAPIPSSSALPECWSKCFDEAGVKSESELCGNKEVDACIQDKCTPAEDKAYWAWYEKFCPAPSSSSAAPVSSGPSGSYSGAIPTTSVCTETSTLIYRSTTEFSTYFVTHTIYESSAPSSSGSPVGADGPGKYGAPSGSAPAYSGPAGSAAPVSSSPASPAGGESCVPDVTVTETVKTTVYVTPSGPYNHAPTSSAAPISSSEAAPSYPAAPSSEAAPSSSAAAPSYPAGSSSEAPSAPSSSAPAPSYSAPATGGQTGKRGLAYNDANLANALSGTAAGGWGYNWLSNSDGLDSSIPYIPMLWGPTSDFTGTWEEDAKAGIAAGAQYLFSFNEVDMSSQANLSPEAAAAAWKQYMEPFAGQAKLVAPSVTNSQSPGMGLDWLESFFEACSGCTIDAVAQHWYFPSNDVGNFKDQITRAAQVGGGKGVFVNEFGAVGTDEEKSQFLSEVMPWLDSNSDVLGYSYFMVSDGLLMTGDGPSTYGKTYSS